MGFGTNGIAVTPPAVAQDVCVCVCVYEAIVGVGFHPWASYMWRDGAIVGVGFHPWAPLIHEVECLNSELKACPCKKNGSKKNSTQ